MQLCEEELSALIFLLQSRFQRHSEAAKMSQIY